MQERRSPVVEFLEGSGTDGRGDVISQILGLVDADLEARHDYIQWLFPLAEPSRAVPGSPVLSKSDIAAIRASDAARANLMAASARMRDFYQHNTHWLRPYDHNHLRISRIIGSLRLLVGDEAAESFRSAVLGYVALAGNRVNTRSLDYWSRA